MSNYSCPIVTPSIQEIYEEIQRTYPEASNRRNLTATDVAGWVDIYSRDKSIPVDRITKKDAMSIVNYIEKCLNMEGKSFKSIPDSITYRYQGKEQTYTILKEEGTSNYSIFNKDGKRVFSEDSKDRRKIFANLAVQQGRAVVVEYKDRKYVVNNKDQIISITTGDEMKWGEENGDRKEILRLSQIAFREKQKAETATTNSNGTVEGVNILGPDTKINIYAGTGENADLSNFAERPLNFGKITAYSLPEGATSGAFKSKYPIYDIGKVTYSTKESPNYGDSFVFDGLSDLFSGRRFKTVEGAFQAAKLVFTHPKGNGAKGNKYWQPKEYTQRENSIDGVYYNTADVFVLTNEGEQLLKKFQEASGAQARSLGRQIEGLDRQGWDANSSKIMKAVIGRSFEANPQALQRLLATGNATLTHTQDKGKWGTEFPKLLMEVRIELGAKTTTDNSGVAQEGVIKVDVFNGYWTREQVANQQDKIFLFGDNTNDRVNTHYVPSSTQAVIRGLPNAIGIDTKKNRGTGANSYFSDADFDQFKAQVDSALNAAKADGRTIVIPADGIGTGKAMLKEKAPKCFEYLQSELQKLKESVSSFQPSLQPVGGNDPQIKVSNDGKLPEKGENMVNKFREYYLWQRKHISFDEANHKYYLDGKLVDYSITGFMETVYGKPNIIGDYSHSQQMGNDVDALTRDFFIKKVDVSKQNYPNLNEERKAAVINDLQRLKEYFDSEFGEGKYKVITSPMVLVGTITVNGETKTIAGTMDMIVVDENGDIYPFDMKVKNHPITKTYNGKEVDDRRNYTFQLNGYRQVMQVAIPGTSGKIKQARLIWFDTTYPRQGREAQFTTDVNTGIVTVSDSNNKNVPLAEYSKWQTPSLKENIKESLIPLETKDVLPNVKKVTVEQQFSSPSTAASASPLSNGGIKFDPVKEKEESDLRKQQQQTVVSQAENSKPKPEKPQSAAYESALNVKDNRVAQFRRTFSSQQIKDRGAMIANMFSDIIEEHLYDLMDAHLEVLEDSSATEEQKNESKQVLHNLKDPLNGRQYAAQDMGIPVILKEIKQRIQGDLEEAADDMKPLWQNTLDYFTDLFNTQATLDIEEKEGIRIVGLDITEQTVTDDENDAQNDGDDEVGHVVSGSDGWSYQVRYTNPFDSLSKRVKSMLYEIRRPRSEADDLGLIRYYPMGRIYASLLSYLSAHMTDSDTFIQVDKNYEGEDRWGNEVTETSYPNGYPTFPVLEQMKSIYPWVQQIIDRLTDDYLNPEWNSNLRYPSTGGSMASQFYTNFRKAYIPYGKIQLGDGKFGVTPLNYQMEERAQYDKLEANYNNRMILSSHSIYNSDGKIDKEHAEWLKKKISDVTFDLDHNDFVNFPELMEWHEQHPEDETLTKEDIEAYDKFINDVRYILQSFGIDATQEGVVAYLTMDEGGVVRKILSDLSYAADRVLKVADDKIDSFNYIIDLKNPYGEPVWKHFFDGRGMITDDSYMQSFYDSASKKTKYSYSADNYLMKTFRGACMGTLEERRAYIDEHFGKYEWFRNQRTGEWRNKWLEYWYNHEGDEKEIPYRNIDNVTEYGDDGEVRIRQYSKWEPDDIWQVQNRSYSPDSKSKTAFYLAPIFSDSPMSMTVKGPKMSMNELLYGYNDDNGHHSGALVSLVNQELYRIGYVQERAKAIEEGRVTPIANFDTGVGEIFCFLPELNTYVFEDTGESFLDRMMRLKAEKATLTAIEESEIQAIQDVLNNKAVAYQIENADEYKSSSLNLEQYYNMVYANAAIIQMTTVDLAFYGKGKRGSVNDTVYQMTVDFQKRFKEVYAGGIQLNTNSKYGKKTENIILLSDDIITSPSYDKIAAIIDSSDTLSQKDKDDIKASFQDINVADAQAIRAMHSFRSVLDMMGNWTDEMEEAINRFKKGTWDRADFDIIFQTIKPFVYSVIERNDGKGGNMLVPQQNKNSEICALMMYDLITNGLNDSPVYKALSRFTEDTVDGDGNHLIDMIQFESAGKVGNQGVINISFNPDKVVSAIENGITVNGSEFEFNPAYKDGKYLDNTVENAEKNYKAIKQEMDKELAEGITTQEEYNEVMSYFRPTEDEIISILEQAALVTNPDGTKGINPETVHTIPFDNYYQQQPTPEHHIDAEATFGSQARNIIVADLPENFELTVPVKGGKHVFKGRDAIIDFYYELLNENLIEDFFGKGGSSKGLKGVFESKEALRDAVTEIVRGNPKYGRDFAEALQIDKETGNFVLNPNSPTIFNLMQEIITSFFKNRITKQTINGAALIQAAGIGLDKDLHMVFDKNGKLVGAECLMPLTSKRFFEPLLETQVIDGKEVKVLNPEKLKKAGLDKAIGYRIPTENKSSMLPLIIKDFTPLQNGSAIVLPAEITDIAGSDFDVDKMFIMLLSFYVQEYDMKAAREAYAREDAIYKEIFSQFTNSQLADDLLDVEPQSFKEWFEENKEDFKLEKPIIRKIEYDFNKTPKENGRKARNNMLIQMMFGILTSKEGSESLFNPQGFKDVERAAKIARILTDDRLKDQLIRNANDVGPGVMPSADQIIAEFLQIIQEKYPDKYTEYKDAVLKMTTEQIQQAYIKAITAGNNESVVSLFMKASTKDLEKFISDYSAPESPIYPQTFAHSHARNMAGMNQIGIYAIQGSMCAKYQRADERMREEQQFTVNGRQIYNVDVSDDGKRLKNVGQMIGASADNGKKPNLSDMGSTTKTAPMIGYMLRIGMSHLEAALIINQPFMKESGFSSKKWEYWKDLLGKNPLATPVDNVTTDTLIKNLISPFELTRDEQKAIAGVCYRILKQHEAQEYMTQISRADSPNGAMQNSYAKARLQRYKVDLFQAKMGQKDFPFVRIKEALSNDAIDTKASEEVVREQLKGQRMGFLHGMYALGINSFNGLVSPYFFGAQQWFDDEIIKPILHNLDAGSTDDEMIRIINAVYTSYITYMLSGSPLFGNEDGASMKSKRDYYLETFPSDYQEIIQNNEEIRDLLGSVLQVKQFGNRKRVILQDVGSLSKGQKQDVQRRFEQLFYMNDPETAKVATKLARDLFIYSYFDNGLQFTHDSFSHLFTTMFLINFDTYTDTLNGLDERITPEEETNFIHQFLLTYPEATYNVNSILKGDEGYTVTDSRITIDLNDKKMREKMVNEVMSPNPQSEGINVYPYIQYQGDVYVLDQELFNQWPGTPVYEKLGSYQTFSKLPLFSRQMSVRQMAEQFPASYSSQQEEEQPSIDLSGSPVAHNEGSGDPNVTPDSMYEDSFGETNGWSPDVDYSDVGAAEEKSPSETYQSEGEGELKDKFC